MTDNTIATVAVVLEADQDSNIGIFALELEGHVYVTGFHTRTTLQARL